MAASTSERLHSISGEAFNRLRNDHEQFLGAYESKLSTESGKVKRNLPPGVGRRS